MSIIVKGGSAAVKKAKSYYDELKKAQAARRKKMEKEKPVSSRRDMGSSTREQRRKNRTGSSGLKVGTEEALAKGAIGVMGGALGTGLIGGGIAIDKASKERGRKHKEKFKKMEKVARKAESEGKKTFTYEGKEYGVNPRYSSGVLGSGLDYFARVKTKSKSKKPVKKAVGGMVQAAKTITKKKTASRNKKGMGTKWESKWG